MFSPGGGYLFLSCFGDFAMGNSIIFTQISNCWQLFQCLICIRFIFLDINIFWKWRFFLHSWNWSLVNKSVLILKIHFLVLLDFRSHMRCYAKMLRCGPPSGKNRRLVCFFGGLQNATAVVEVEQTHSNVVVHPLFQDWMQTLWNDISARGGSYTFQSSKSICVCLHNPPGSPDNSRSDFSTEEDAERADRVRGKHSDDGECHWEFPVQSVSQDCAQE